MNTKYTPGPWKSTVIGTSTKGGKAKLAVIIPGEGLRIKRIVCEVSTYEKRDTEDSHNSQLIAAAPCMFEALESALSLLPCDTTKMLCDCEGCKAYYKVRDVITKAKGGSE
jgi:hypothetical protein